MKIENLRLEKNGEKARVTADVYWEERNRPVLELYFETSAEFSDDLSCNPHAFLIACSIAAMHHGEERVFINEEVCPELRDGLMTAMGWIQHWYGYKRNIIQIDAKPGQGPQNPRTQARAGCFFSGGIDSLAALRYNRINFPLKHPLSIKDGLIVCGLELQDQEKFAYVLKSLSVLAHDADMTLIPIYTNIRNLDDDWAFWDSEFEGAVFASIAHAFANRFSVVSIASTHNIRYSHPHGSHPLLDNNYSNYDLRIRHELLTLSRIERTKLLLNWDAALQNLRVCNRTTLYKEDMLNCGRCEKCVRTMLSLLALGGLGQTRSFPMNDISEEQIISMGTLNDTTYPFYPELISPLAEKGRQDLVRAIKRQITRYKTTFKVNRWMIKRWNRLIEPIKEVDRIYLNGTTRKLKRWFYTAIKKTKSLK